MQGYLRTPEAAEYLGVSRSWMEKARVAGTGPKFCNIGPRLVAYRAVDLDAWVQAQARTSTSERAAA